MENKLFCEECKKEVQVGEQTDLAECIDYRDNHDGLVCEVCYGKLKGFSNVMILTLKREELYKQKCLRCGYTWFPKSTKLPKTCPKCKSPYWMKPRQVKGSNNV
jgi:hypothetical protein